MSSKSSWYTKQVLVQLRVHREILSQRKAKEREKKNLLYIITFIFRFKGHYAKARLKAHSMWILSEAPVTSLLSAG